jgi:hypothetical protein
VELGSRHTATGPHRVAPVERVTRWHEERRDGRTAYLAKATLACPGCDAPVAPPELAVPVTHELACPYCGRGGPAREFLSFDRPVRPAVVTVRIALRASR